MSNITAPNIVGRHHLIHCAAVALALSTAFVVVTMPKPDTAAASTTNNEANSDAKTAANTATCLQTWPYYERSCLRDGRQRGGDARIVRVIAINGQARHHASRQ